MIDNTNQLLKYTVTLVNDGTEAISDITATDSLAGALSVPTGNDENVDPDVFVHTFNGLDGLAGTGDDITLTVTHAAGYTGNLDDATLDPLETWTWTYNYSPTQGDIDQFGNPVGSGFIKNVVTVGTTDTDVAQALTDANHNPDSEYTKVAVHENLDWANPGLSKGFWANHPTVWNGIFTDDGSGKGGGWTKLFPDVISQNQDLNANHSGNLVLGDVNENGFADDPAGDLTFADAMAKVLITSSVVGDMRVAVASQALAVQLNDYNDGSAALNDGNEPNGLIEAAVKWLSTGYSAAETALGHLTGGDIDQDNNGTIDFVTDYTTPAKNGSIVFTGNKVTGSSNAWNAYATVLPGAWHDQVDNTDHAGVAANGSGLANALQLFANDGNGLMVTADGLWVGWGTNGGATVDDVHPNTSRAFWGILADHNVGGVHFI